MFDHAPRVLHRQGSARRVRPRLRCPADCGGACTGVQSLFPFGHPVDLEAVVRPNSAGAILAEIFNAVPLTLTFPDSGRSSD